MKRVGILILLCALLLSGCDGLLSGSYLSVRPHQEQGGQTGAQNVSAASYTGLCRALEDMVRAGVESGLIFVTNYDQAKISADITEAVRETLEEDPIGAYAAEAIDCELGTNSGQPAIAVSIRYIHDRSEIRRIKTVADPEEAKEAIERALKNCDSGLVLYIKNYVELDYPQFVTDYAALNPDIVMEYPQTAVSTYPESGNERVLELKFTYQNSRDVLRTMQTQVSTLFNAAENYVRVTEQPREKFSQMYSFLMERFEDYQLETSLTPAYSLLLHGVGDARTFATVYAAMCQQAELECITVTGTKNGEPWFWNIISHDGMYYHVDLLQCSRNGAFREYGDEQMGGYVWDYSAYPACGVPQEQATGSN